MEALGLVPCIYQCRVTGNCIVFKSMSTVLESRALSSSHVSSVDDVRPISYTPLSNCPTIDIIIISSDHVVS